MFLVPLLLLLTSSSLAQGDLAGDGLDDVILMGSDHHNTRNFDSSINKNNVDRLQLNWAANICGAATATPLVKDDSVYVSDFGACFTRFDRATGQIIWRKNLTEYGFPAGLYARGMPTYYDDGLGGLAILGTSSIKNLLAPGVGAWIFATRLLTGELVWKTLVSDFAWTIMTQSPLIHNGIIYIGTSSGEAAAPLQPGYNCCSFVGGMGAYYASNGQKIWFEPNAPLEITGPGKYSGMAVWGSTPIIVGDDIYFGTGQLYSVPPEAANCINANPLNGSCIDSRLMTDSVVRRDRNTGALKGFTRLTVADVWNIACFLRLPACQTPAAAYDFDITSVTYSKKTDTLYAGSKSGFIWSFERDLKIRWGQQEVQGSTAGGFVWQLALSDDEDLDELRVYGTFTNAGFKTWQPSPGVNSTAGGVIAYDGRGNKKAVLASPSGDMMYGATSLTNNVVFAQDRTKGNLYGLNARHLNVLWTFNVLAPMSGAPAIVNKEVFWGTGATNFATPPPRQLYAFKIVPRID